MNINIHEKYVFIQIPNNNLGYVVLVLYFYLKEVNVPYNVPYNLNISKAWSVQLPDFTGKLQICILRK